jgi:hypothetical protein
MAAQTNAELGATLVGYTIAVGTKDKYDGKVVHCVEFFRKQFPEYHEVNASIFLTCCFYLISVFCVLPSLVARRAPNHAERRPPD